MPTSGIIRRAFALLFLAVITFAGAAIAGSANLNSDGIAIDGHDPVAYFTMNKAVRGDDAFTVTHQGATYRFASAEHKAMFESDPARYTPQYGGYCAFGAAQGYKAPVEADKFTIVDGKLYLNYNGQVQSTWRKDTAGYIAGADSWWATQ